MNAAVAFVFSGAILSFVAWRIGRAAESARVRFLLLAQVAAASVSVILLFLHAAVAAIFTPTGRDVVLALSSLASGLAAACGLAVVRYVIEGKTLKIFYALALAAAVPRIGPFVAALLWLGIPLSIALLKTKAPSEESILKARTIVNGTLAGGLLMLLLAAARRLAGEPMALELLAVAIGPLFLSAGLFARRDPENEFSYEEVSRLVRNGILVIISAAILPPLLFSPRAFLVLHRFLVPAALALACAFLLILVFHFEARNIRTFLALLFIAFAPTALGRLYGEQIDAACLDGLRLFTRTALVLSSLFILRQYMRWGFEIAQTMVMFITAVAFASIVLIVVAVIEPVEGVTVPPGIETVRQATLVLDLVILASLPPLLVNYGRGTMKVTWAILGFGLFLETYQDFLDPVSQGHEAAVAAALAYGFIALAFVTLWLYTSVLMRDIKSISHRLDAA